MVAALELYLDPVAERRVRVLWDALETAGIPSMRGLLNGKHRPHLSLAVADGFEPDRVREALDGFDVAPPLRLSFQFAAYFVGRVLFLGPAPTATLLGHQAEVWRRLSVAGLTLSDLYTPGGWIPHCTVSMRVPRPMVSEALRLCLEVLPIEASLRGAAVADHSHEVYEVLA